MRWAVAIAMLLGCGAGPGQTHSGCDRAYRRCLNGVQELCPIEIFDPHCIVRETANCWEGAKVCHSLGAEQ